MRAAGHNPVRLLVRAFPRSLEEVGFNPAGAGYRLKDSSRYKNAVADGTDIGVDFDALWRALGPTLGAEARNGR